MSMVNEFGADLVLYNGKVVTVDVDGSEVEAVAVREGKIIKVGNNAEILE